MKFLSDFVESLFFHCDGRAYWKPELYGLRGDEFKVRTSVGNELDCNAPVRVATYSEQE